MSLADVKDSLIADVEALLSEPKYADLSDADKAKIKKVLETGLSEESDLHTGEAEDMENKGHIGMF